MANNVNSKFKLKDPPNKEEAESSKVSKYFKPGFIFNQQKTDDTDELSDVSDADYEEAITQASEKFKKIKTEATTSSSASNKGTSMKPDALARVNQVDSQSVDFTSTSSKCTSSQIPSLKGNNTILVNSNQQPNPLLQSLRSSSVHFKITDSIAPAHYLLSDSCCALFLSLKYHVIHPDYIYEHINNLQSKYQLKVLLVLMDHPIFDTHLKELSILAVRTNFTLMLAWSYEEAARHIVNYRINADKPADVIMGRNDDSSKSAATSQQQSLMDALTSVKSVNRTDANTLMYTFETFDSIIKANVDELTVCPGISMVKARRLHALFNKPFIKAPNADVL